MIHFKYLISLSKSLLRHSIVYNIIWYLFVYKSSDFLHRTLPKITHSIPLISNALIANQRLDDINHCLKSHRHEGGGYNSQNSVLLLVTGDKTTAGNCDLFGP